MSRRRRIIHTTWTTYHSAGVYLMANRPLTHWVSLRAMPLWQREVRTLWTKHDIWDYISGYRTRSQLLAYLHGELPFGGRP